MAGALLVDMSHPVGGGAVIATINAQWDGKIAPLRQLFSVDPLRSGRPVGGEMYWCLS